MKKTEEPIDIKISEVDDKTTHAEVFIDGNLVMKIYLEITLDTKIHLKHITDLTPKEVLLDFVKRELEKQTSSK